MQLLHVDRFNADFGNSMYMNIINNYYFEIPTNVVEISKQEAENHFVSTISDPKDLLDRLLISTTFPGEEDQERFFLVGKEAEKHKLANNHVNKLHDKIKSPIPYVMFLAASMYYFTSEGSKDRTDMKEPNEAQAAFDGIMSIGYFQTMLPIWLLKRTEKFSEAQKAMADRFAGDHTVTCHTPGLECKLKVSVNESVCRIEGEVARFAIKKDFELNDREEAKQFDKNDTVMVDLGGGTNDLVLLPAGLKAPKDRHSMQFVADLPYLAHLEQLRKDKLLEYFSDLRSLEDFIVDNYAKTKMELVDGNNGRKIDLTPIIRPSLKEFSRILILKIQETIPAPPDRTYKYVYFGGVADVLEKSIIEVLTEMIGEELARENHIFLPDARKLNLLALEVLSRAKTLAIA